MIVKNPIAATGVYEIVPGFIVGALITILVSLLTAAPTKEVTDIFDAALAADDEV